MKASFYENNRAKLVAQLSGGLVCIAAYSRVQRTNDTFQPFVQEASFLYLSGIVEPDCWLIIDGHSQKSWLVAPSVGSVHQTFDGSLDADQAQQISGITKVVEAREGEALLRQLARKHSIVYTVDQPSWIDRTNFVPNPALAKHRAMLERIFTKVQSCNKELASLRAYKQPEELAAITKATNATVAAFAKVHAKLATYGHEYEVEAEFSYEFRRQGLSHAYDPIVAYGANACTLHYTKNSDVLRGKNFLLMDVGASVDGYASDITRTYAYKEPTKRQAAVHQAVQEAQQQIIALLGPDVDVARYQTQVDEIMLEALRSLNLVGSDPHKSLRRYMPHAVSHGLGLDVHDSLGGPAAFAPSMVLTVEPGIYIPEESIGVRIEDDIVITDSGRKNLSQKLPISW